MEIDLTFNELHHVGSLNVYGHLCLMAIDLTFNELHHVETLIFKIYISNRLSMCQITERLET